MNFRKTFNDYFINIPTQNILTNQGPEFFDSSKKDTLLRIIEKYQNYPGIMIIKAKNKSQTFRFQETNIDEIKKSIQNHDFKKFCHNRPKEWNSCKCNLQSTTSAFPTSCE